MKLFTLSENERVKEACKLAQSYIGSDDFIRDIMSVEKFEESNIDPMTICNLFEKFAKNKIQVKVSYFGFFYKKVLGRTVGDGCVYLNSSRLDRQLWSIGATIVHEASHVVDEFFPMARFGHGSNSSVGKGQTFPYFIGERAENWIKREVLNNESKKLSMKITLLREVELC